MDIFGALDLTFKPWQRHKVGRGKVWVGTIVYTVFPVQPIPGVCEVIYEEEDG